MEIRFTHNGLKKYYLEDKLIKMLDKKGRIHYFRKDGTTRKIVDTLHKEG